MRIETICENRKELVKAMAEILGEPSKYLGPPSFGYQIGGAIVDRDGNIETEDGEMLQKELQRRGFIENNQEELNLQIPIEGHTAESIRNLIFMIHSKQYLLKRAVGTEVLHMSERLIERLSEEKDADMNRVMEIFEEEKVHCFGLEFVADKIVFNGFPMEAESTISFAELTCMMAERAKEMKWINPAETIEANEKYYMRIWLIRLGLDFGLKADHYPFRPHENDAGADVFMPYDCVLKPGEVARIPLGFGLIIPDGFAGYVFPRSSMAAKGLVCELPPIDSGYRGEIHAIISNVSTSSQTIHKDTRVGQLVITPVVIADFVLDLGNERGTGAFGSTGE